MLAYRITRFEKDDPEYIVWAGTMREAHDQLKEFSGHPDARIELFDIPIDKVGVLRLLHGATPEDLKLVPFCTWALTPRKGLKEVPIGE